jgi:hypothetical protein
LRERRELSSCNIARREEIKEEEEDEEDPNF